MIIKVKIYPKSKKQEIKKTEGREDYKVYLKAPPEDNKANLELIKLLKKYFSEYENIQIKLGLKSRQKIVELR